MWSFGQKEKKYRAPKDFFLFFYRISIFTALGKNWCAPETFFVHTRNFLWRVISGMRKLRVRTRYCKKTNKTKNNHVPVGAP